MKKFSGIVVAVLVAFAATLIAPIISSDSGNVAYASWRCKKCGHSTSAKDPYMGSQKCPKGGNHDWYEK